MAVVSCPARRPGFYLNLGIIKTNWTGVAATKQLLADNPGFSGIFAIFLWSRVEGAEDDYSQMETITEMLVDIAVTADVGIAMEAYPTRWALQPWASKGSMPDYIANDTTTYPSDPRGAPWGSQGGFYFSTDSNDAAAIYRGDDDAKGRWLQRIWGVPMEAYRQRLANLFIHFATYLQNRAGGDELDRLAYVTPWGETALHNRQKNADYTYSGYMDGIVDLMTKVRTGLDLLGPDGQGVATICSCNFSVTNWAVDLLDPIQAIGGRNGMGVRDVVVTIGTGDFQEGKGCGKSGSAYPNHPKHDLYEYIMNNHTAVPAVAVADNLFHPQCNGRTGQKQTIAEFVKMCNGTLHIEDPGYLTTTGFFCSVSPSRPNVPFHYLQVHTYDLIHRASILEGINGQRLLNDDQCRDYVPPGDAPDAPVITPTGGDKTYPITVTITPDVNADATYYTLDGSLPTASDTAYTVPLSVTEPTTVRSRSIESEVWSSVSTIEYTLVEDDGGDVGGTPVDRNKTASLGIPTTSREYLEIDSTDSLRPTYTFDWQGGPSASAPITSREDPSATFEGGAGTNTGGPTFAADPNSEGPEVMLDANKTGYLSLPTPITGRPWTVLVAWRWPNGSSFGADRGIFAVGEDPATNEDYASIIMAGATAGKPYVAYGEQGSQGDGRDSWNGSGLDHENDKYFVGVLTAASGTSVRAYVAADDDAAFTDLGEMSASANFTSPITDFPLDRIWIGSMRADTAGASEQPNGCYISGVQVWDGTALTEAQLNTRLNDTDGFWQHSTLIAGGTGGGVSGSEPTRTTIIGMPTDNRADLISDTGNALRPTYTIYPGGDIAQTIPARSLEDAGTTLSGGIVI